MLDLFRKDRWHLGQWCMGLLLLLFALTPPMELAPTAGGPPWGLGLTPPSMC